MSRSRETLRGLIKAAFALKGSGLAGLLGAWRPLLECCQDDVLWGPKQWTSSPS